MLSDNFQKQFTSKSGRDSYFAALARKKRGAWQNHKRLSYCRINVYRTSLDHLLLGMDADIDRMSIGPIIKRFVKMFKIDFWMVSIPKMNRNKPPGTT